MTELKCTRCGMTRSHADASIEDMDKTCEKTEEVEIADMHEPETSPDSTGVHADEWNEPTRSVTNAVEHNWMEVSEE